MNKITVTDWNELWPIGNMLNEICHGIPINNLENTIGFKYEDAFTLLRKISDYEIQKEQLGNLIQLELTNNEIEIIKRSFKEVKKGIEDWEFQTRIGVTIEEANELVLKLCGQ